VSASHAQSLPPEPVVVKTNRDLQGRGRRVGCAMTLCTFVRLGHARFTPTFSCAPHVRISVSSGWLTFRTRACAFFPPLLS
jgi:hypothetical protein